MSAADHRRPTRGCDSRRHAPPPARTRLGLIGVFAALGGFGLFSAPAWPQLAGVAQAPLSLATNPKPNVMFILDNSGSMTRDYMPDDLNGAPTHGMLSAWCNGVAFDPEEDYPAPPKADGSSSGDSTFTAAWADGFARTGAVNLEGSTYYVFNDSTATPRDWRYDVNGNVDTSSDTYRYCMNRSESGRFTAVTISASSALAQKYANWYSYYRTRQLAMRSAAGKAMRGVGAEIRLGFTRISDSTSSGSWFLGTGEFSGTQRASFYDLLYTSSASSSTPLRRTLSRVGRYYATTGSSAPIQYTCQRTYALLTTDGYWNSDTGQVYALDGRTQIGDADATEPRPYNGANASPSLADVAQYYYQEDLRPDLDNKLTPVSGDDAKGVLPDPKTQQHMNVFTLGLGLNGYLRPSDWADLKSATGSKTWPVPTGTINTGSEGDATHIDDLWHAAVNGRGQYYSASNHAAVASAIADTFRRIGDVSASAAAITSSTQTPVDADRWVFLPSYTSGTWSGDLKAYQYQPGTTAGTYTVPTMGSSTPVWSAAAQLDARLSAGGSRDIWFNQNGIKGDFSYANLSNTGSTALNAAFDGRCSTASERLSQCSTDTMMNERDRNLVTGANLVEYLRGTSTYENDNTTATPLLFRGRSSALGDIVNAAPAYAGKPPFSYADAGYSSYVSSKASRMKMVFAAANDGMLHAFQVDSSVSGSTTTPAGSERWAFVPTAVIPNLWKLADSSYGGNHRYFVDGTPVVADIYVDGNWHTILVGGLGAGGRSYYALDITNPDTPVLLWEFGYFPGLSSTYGKVIHNANLGLAMGNPVITKNANGKWVVAFTSGVNNSNGINSDAGDGEGRLFVLDAFTGTLLSEVKTGVGSATAPSNLLKLNAWVASSSDNTALRFYAGDMLGNLWRFVPTYTAGSVTQVAAQLLARTPDRPITTKPALNEVATGSGSIPVVSFGTGRYLGDADVRDSSQQAIYSIKDTWSTSEGQGLEVLAAADNRLTQITLSTEGTQTVDWSTKKGWYAELPTNQRVAINPTALGNGILAFVGTSPSPDMCSGGGSSTLYQFNISSGKVTGMANYANPMIVGIERFDDGQGNIKAFLNFADQTGAQENSAGVAGSTTYTARRTSWRELTD